MNCCFLDCYNTADRVRYVKNPKTKKYYSLSTCRWCSKRNTFNDSVDLASLKEIETLTYVDCYLYTLKDEPHGLLFDSLQPQTINVSLSDVS